MVTIKRWRIGAIVVLAFASGLVVRVGDGIVDLALMAGLGAAVLVGWWLRDAEALEIDQDRQRVAHAVERGTVGSKGREAVQQLRRAVDGSPAPVEAIARHPFVTRPDVDSDDEPAVGLRRGPSRL